MSQQPPEWWSRQRGPRFGCADVTIVSIASITAFVILIFVVLRPDSGKVVDVTGGNNNATVSSFRATETAGPGSGSSTRTPGGAALAGPTTPAALPAPTSTPPAPAATATPPPTTAPTFRRASTRDECRLRQDSTFEATVIQIFKPNTPFKIYTEQRPGTNNSTWLRVEPDDGTNRQGWMVASCFG